MELENWAGISSVRDSLDERTAFGSRTQTPIDLTHFLPYIVHRLWAGISVARSIPDLDGFTPRTREWRVLMILASFGQMTSAEIAAHAAMDTGTTARAVKRLLDAGMLTGKTPKADKRKQILALTPKGVLAHDKIAEVRMAFSANLLDGFSKAEADQLFNLLARLDTNVQALTKGTEGEWIESE